MLPIFIYSKQTSHLPIFSKVLNNILFMEDYDASILSSTNQCPALVEQLQSLSVQLANPIGLYIIEWCQETIAEISSLLATIRRYDSRGFLLLISYSQMLLSESSFSEKNLLYDSTHTLIQYEILDYLIKPSVDQLAACFHQVIQTALARQTHSHFQAIFHLSSNYQTYRIPYQEILYIATLDSHRLVLKTIFSEYIFYDTINACFERLNTCFDQLNASTNVNLEFCFIKCHRAIIINAQHIRQINHKNLEITFSNGDTCIASVRGMRHLLQTLELRNV